MSKMESLEEIAKEAESLFVAAESAQGGVQATKPAVTRRYYYVDGQGKMRQFQNPNLFGLAFVTLGKMWDVERIIEAQNWNPKRSNRHDPDLLIRAVSSGYVSMVKNYALNVAERPGQEAMQEQTRFLVKDLSYLEKITGIAPTTEVLDHIANTVSLHQRATEVGPSVIVFVDYLQRANVRPSPAGLVNLRRAVVSRDLAPSLAAVNKVQSLMPDEDVVEDVHSYVIQAREKKGLAPSPKKNPFLAVPRREIARRFPGEFYELFGEHLNKLSGVEQSGEHTPSSVSTLYAMLNDASNIPEAEKMPQDLADKLAGLVPVQFARGKTGVTAAGASETLKTLVDTGVLSLSHSCLEAGFEQGANILHKDYEGLIGGKGTPGYPLRQSQFGRRIGNFLTFVTALSPGLAQTETYATLQSLQEQLTGKGAV